jgi:hypothetical protein
MRFTSETIGGITREHKPVMAVEVKTGDLHLANSLKNRAKWFPDSTTLRIQVVDRRGALQKFPENTWIVSMERFLSLLD